MAAVSGRTSRILAAVAALVVVATASLVDGPAASASQTAPSHRRLASGPPVRAVQPRLTIGNSACGHLKMTPYQGVKGGTKLTIKLSWHGSPSNSGCSVLDTNCHEVWFGSCDAGYWVIGAFCSTLAAADLGNALGDCDLSNVIVMSDYNSGPNDPGDNHGTSYNQCTTVQSLGNLFGGLPATLNCAADHKASGGWHDQWRLGNITGTITGPAEETGTSYPFSPATAGVDCPPSAANIAAGAIKNACAFVVIPVSFQYYCEVACVPDTSLPNDGITYNTSNFFATLFTYAKTT